MLSGKHWFSLFIMYRWIHLFFTCIFHGLLLRDVEKHIGWFRVGIIYLGSGFAGNIFSGTFIPYFPAVSVCVVCCALCVLCVCVCVCVCSHTYVLAYVYCVI